jgi:Xaa-Pro aminopeptidase
MNTRIDSLRRRLDQSELDAVLISQAENRRYLSGFTGSAGFLLISRERALLATDFRYIEQAEDEAPAFEIVRIQGALSSWFPPLPADLGVRRLGFEKKDLSFGTYTELASALCESGSETALVPAGELVEALRSVKDEGELRHLEAAAALADAALAEVLPAIESGISEKEVAWRLEISLRQHGSEPLPFEIIVASGPNSALPHARPTDKTIRDGEPVVMDLGAKVNGYCSDMTRTVCLGKEDSTFSRIYDIVLGAQLTALATLQVGMTGEQADQLGRTVIAQAGYEENFGHSLGHGVGLAAHEEPRLGSNSTSTLADHMVFTIEPGIYIPGWGGVRIEDTVALEKGKLLQFTTAGKIRR